MGALRSFALLMSILVTSSGDEPPSGLPIASQTEIDILRRLGARINEPINFDGLSISAECRQSTELFLNGLKKLELWAMKMHDSKATLPSGILRGNIHQYGDFDLCLSSTASDDTFSGKYCLANIQMTVPDNLRLLKAVKAEFVLEELFKSNFTDPTFIVPRSSEIHWGVCLPSTCSSSEAELYVKSLLLDSLAESGIEVQVEVKSSQCSIDDGNWMLKLDLSTIVINSLLALYVLFVIFSTFYDYFSRSNDKNKWIAAFSMIKNAKEILDTTPNSSEVSTLHGVRFINVVCVFLVHKSMVLNFYPYFGKIHLLDIARSPISYPFRAAYVYTEPFLMLSGLLLAHSIIGRLQKSVKIDFLKEIAGRVLRVMPPFIVIVILSTWTVPLLGSGPFWVINKDESELCKASWIKNFLLIHNFFGMENICLPQTHHVATDFWLFVFSLFLIVYAYKHPWRGSLGIGILALVSFVGKFYVTKSLNLAPFLTHGTDIQSLIRTCDKFYFLPPYRFTSFAMGILLGYVIRSNKNVTWSSGKLLLGHAVAVLCFVATAMLMHINRTYNPINQAAFATFAPVTWSWVCAWLVLASHFGPKNSLVRFFEWKFFKVTTNIAYAYYLVQFPVFNFFLGIARSAAPASLYRALFDLNELVVVIAASILLTIFVEFPFGNIKKLIFDSDRQKLKVK